MGMTERLMVNFEDTTLEYQGKKLYIIKQFEHEKILYLYGVDIETIDDDKEMEFAFLYRLDGDIFTHVVDEALLDELFDIVEGLCAADIVKKNVEEYINAQKNNGK